MLFFTITGALLVLMVTHYAMYRMGLEEGGDAALRQLEDHIETAYNAEPDLLDVREIEIFTLLDMAVVEEQDMDLHHATPGEVTIHELSHLGSIGGVT